MTPQDAMPSDDELIPADDQLTPVDDAMPSDAELTPADEELTPVDQPAFEPVPPTADVAVEPAPDWFTPAYRAGKTKDPLPPNYVIARDLGVPERHVEADPRNYYQLAQAQKLAPFWQRNNPDLAAVAEKHPDIAPVVVHTEKATAEMVKAWAYAVDAFTGLLPDVDPVAKFTFKHPGLETAAGIYGSFFPKYGKDLDRLEMLRAKGLDDSTAIAAVELGNENKRKSELDKTLAPKTVEEVDSPEAEVLRNPETATQAVVYPAFILAKRIGESYLGLEAARLTVERMSMLDENENADTSDIDERIAEAKKNAAPQFYDEGPIAQQIATSAQAAVSMLEMGRDALSFGGAGAAVGAVGGAVIGGVGGKSLKAAASGAAAGAKALGKRGAQYGAFHGSYNMELASTYDDLASAETDAGQRLTEPERRGTAKAAALVKAIIEMDQLATFFTQAAPLKALGEEGVKKAIIGLSLRDAGFRLMLKRMAKSTFKEMLEEGAQTGVDQVFEYLAVSVAGGELSMQPVLKGTPIVESMQAAGGMSVVLGGVATGKAIINNNIEVEQAQASQAQVKAVNALAEQESIQAIAPAMAGHIAARTGATGSGSVKAHHVKGEAIQRFYQEKGATEDEVREDLASHGLTPEDVAEAKANGGTVAVSMEQVLSTWGKSDIGKATADDTTTQPGLLTPREMTSGGTERIEADSKRLLAEYTSNTAKAVEVATYAQDIERRAIAAGADKGRAKAASVLFRHYVETRAAEGNGSVAELAAKYRIEIGIGDERAVGELSERPPPPPPASQVELEDYFDNADAAKRAYDLYRDDVSGLRNRVAHDAEYDKGPVGLLTLHDVKPVNDHEHGGHDKANDLLSRIAAAVASVAPNAARGGTNFIIKPELLEQAQKAVEAVLPEGMKLIAAQAENIDAAFKRLDETGDALRAEGKLPARGVTQADLSKLATTDYKAAPTATPITEAELARTGAMGRDQLISDTFYDHSEETGVPGMLSKVGFDRTAPKAFTLAMDKRMLKVINTRYGKGIGNIMLRKFAETAMALGGADVYFAHLSGDEYAAKSDDKAQLVEFQRRLEAHLRDVVDFVSVGDEVVELSPRFRSGIGEKTYGAADRVLNAAKRAEAEQHGPVTQAEDDYRRTGGVLVRKSERRSEVPGEQGVPQAPGDVADESGAGGNAEEVPVDAAADDTSFDVAALDAAIEEDKSKLSEEDAAFRKKAQAEATSFVGRMRNKTKKAYARAWLAFVLGKAERPVSLVDAIGEKANRDLMNEIKKDIARFGLVDPEGFAFDANGVALDVTKKHGSRGRGAHQEQPAALQRYRNEDFHYFNRGMTTRLRQDFTSDKTDAAAAGFHSPNAFAGAGMRAHEVAETFLQALGGRSAEEVTNEEIKAAWTASLQRLGELRASVADISRAQAKEENLQKHDDATTTEANVVASRSRGVNPSDFIAQTEWIGAEDEGAVEDLSTATEPTSPREERAYWRQIEQAARAALNGDRTLLYQLGSTEQAPRGYIELPETRAVDRTIRIFLNKSADRSTLTHEMGHAFLDMLQDMASQPGAGERTRRIYDEARKALGVEDGKPIATVHHERFADTFNRWLEKGEAPSAALETTFNRFKKWLRGIYNVVRGTPSDLNPELSRVFEQLFATDRAIEDYKRAHGPEVFPDAKAARLTPEQWLDQKLDDDDILEAGSQAAQLAVLKDLHRTSERWWKKELGQRTKAAKAAWKNLPARRAQVALEGTEASEADVVAALLTDDNGEPLYPTGAAMLEAVAALQPQDKWAAAQAESEMAEAYPSTLDDRAKLSKLLEDGLRKYSIERQLRDQRELAKRAGDTGPGIPLEAYAKAADGIVAGRTLDNISPTHALQRERAAAKAKAVAAAKGDWTAAKKHGEQQLLNAQIHRALIEARDERDTFGELTKRLGKRSAQETLGKAGAEYQGAVNFILEALGVRDPDGNSVQDIPELGEWVQPVRAALAKGDAMTVADMRLISDGLTWTYDAAREATTALKNRERYEKTQTIADLNNSAEENKRRRPALSASEGSKTLGQAAGEIPTEIVAGVLKAETLASWLGGALKGDDWYDSPWFTAIIQPVRNAEAAASDLIKKTIEPIETALSKMSAKGRNRLMEAVDGKALFPQHSVKSGQAIEPPNTRFHLVMIAANYGNSSNAQRMRDGRNLTHAQVMKALSMLTAEEIGFVNAIWAANESLKGPAFDLEFKLTGIRPVGFEPAPLDLPNGRLTGGYVPAKYDQRVERVGEMQASAVDDLLAQQRFGAAATMRSHLKQRAAEFDGAIQLDPDIFMAHLHQVIHDVTHREAVRSVAGLLFDPSVAATMKERLGIMGTKSMQDWIKHVAAPQALAGGQNLHWVTQIFKGIKGNLVFNALAYSMPNAMEDLSNIPAALVATDLKTQHLATGLLKMMSSPLKAIEEVEKLSPTMRAMNDSRARELTRQIKSVTPGWWERSPGLGRLLRTAPFRWTGEQLEKHAFDLMEASFKATATPVWIGRYEQALANGESQAKAIVLADAAVRKVFPKHGAADTTAFSRHPWGGLLVFDGWMSTARNVYFTETQRVIEGDFEQKRRGIFRLAGYSMAAIVFSAFMRGRGPGDDDESIAGWAVEKTLLGIPEILIPGASDLVQMGHAKYKGKHFTPRGGTIAGAVKAIFDAVDAAFGDKEDEKKIEAAYRALGPFTKLPVSQPIRSGKFIFGDKIEGPLDAPSGLIYGDNPKNAANPFNLGPMMEKPLLPQ